MGNALSSIIEDRLNPRYECTMLGLEFSGKTSIISFVRNTPLPPSIGFAEIMLYRRIQVTAYNLSVHNYNKLIHLFRHYFCKDKGLIFTVDSNDVVSLNEARDVLQLLLEEHSLAAKPLLVYATKQDLPEAMKVEKITDFLRLEHITNRPWHIEGICSLTGDGIYEGLDWIQGQIEIR